jgi:hypothetical protein
VLGVELGGPILSESSRTVFNEGGGGGVATEKGGGILRSEHQGGYRWSIAYPFNIPFRVPIFFLRIVCDE